MQTGSGSISGGSALAKRQWHADGCKLMDRLWVGAGRYARPLVADATPVQEPVLLAPVHCLVVSTFSAILGREFDLIAEV